MLRGLCRYRYENPSTNFRDQNPTRHDLRVDDIRGSAGADVAIPDPVSAVVGPSTVSPTSPSRHAALRGIHQLVQSSDSIFGHCVKQQQQCSPTEQHLSTNRHCRGPTPRLYRLRRKLRRWRGKQHQHFNRRRDYSHGHQPPELPQNLLLPTHYHSDRTDSEHHGHGYHRRGGGTLLPG